MQDKEIIKKGKYNKRGNPWQHIEEIPLLDGNGEPLLDSNGNQKFKKVKKDWRFYYFVTDQKSKKKKQKYKFGYKSKTEAENALNEIKQKIADKLDISNEDLTLEEYLNEWIEELMPKYNYSPCTERGYLVNIRNHIIPNMGARKLKDITCRDLEDFYMDIWNKGRGLAKNTIKYVRATLLTIFNDALKDRLISRNEAVLSKIPNRIVSPRFKYVTYTLAEVLKLIKITEKTYFQPAIALAGICGLRRGEILGLKYSDIDLLTGKINVHRQIIYEDKEMIYKEVKSGSVRAFYLPKSVLKVILKYKERQQKLKTLLGNDYTDNGYIICNDDGSMIIPGTFSKKFNKILRDNNMKIVRFHDMRHSANSLMQAFDVSKEERKHITGHATDDMDDLYTHIQDEALKRVSNRMDEKIMEVGDPIDGDILLQ